MRPGILALAAAAALVACTAGPAAAQEPALTLTAPAVVQYGTAVKLSGTVQPAIANARVRIYRGGAYVTTVYADASGRFGASVRGTTPGAFEARMAEWRSPQVAVALRPSLRLVVPETAVAGAPVRPTVVLEPRAAGPARVTQAQGAQVVRVWAATKARGGFAAVRAKAVVRVLATPPLAAGSRGAGVRALERALRDRRFALKAVDGLYAGDTSEAVLALQKLSGLPRTGRVDRATWRALLAFRPPHSRAPSVQGRHIEVDKTRQVLLEWESGEVVRIVHVSTGATGNTPVGRFQVYRRVTGFDWVLYYPLYFKGGFAVHGYPSVPAYPASHGCVRIPMWVAPSLFSRHAMGTAVVVYL
jgi:N-acetylmuramoyl-L-alanine amidase